MQVDPVPRSLEPEAVDESVRPTASVSLHFTEGGT